MAEFNKTLQQITGYTSLLSNLNRGKLETPVEQKPYKNFSDSVRADVRKHGIQKTSMAHIVFDPPKLFGTQLKIAGAKKIASIATYRGDTFTQPGVSMATTEIKRYGIGPIERKPYLPIFLGDVQRSWADANQFVRFPVTFTYSHWKYEKLPDTLDPQAFVTKMSGRNLSLTQNIMKYASVLQTISSTKRPQNVNDILNIVNSGSTILKSLFPPTLEPLVVDYYAKK